MYFVTQTGYRILFNSASNALSLAFFGVHAVYNVSQLGATPPRQPAGGAFEDLGPYGFYAHETDDGRPCDYDDPSDFDADSLAARLTRVKLADSNRQDFNGLEGWVRKFSLIDGSPLVKLYCGAWVNVSGNNLIAANNQWFNNLIPANNQRYSKG